MPRLSLTNPKKVSIFEDNVFETMSKSSDRNKILNAIKNRDTNIDIRKEKIKERNSVKTIDAEIQQKINNDVSIDQISKSDTSILSKLPTFEIPTTKNLFTNFKNEAKEETKLKTLLEISNDQANNIFQEKIKNDNSNFLLLTNKLESAHKSDENLSKLNVIKPIQMNKTLTNGTKFLNSKNIALQEYRLETILKNLDSFCNHSTCKNFLKYYKQLNLSTESAYSFLRRYLLFEMEIFESKEYLSKGNIRQECFLSIVYNDFLKKSYKMAGDFNSPVPQWNFLSTIMDVQEEVDFDLKYWCMKEECSLNECSILNDDLYNSNQTEIDYLGNQCVAVTNKENISDVYVELASFAKPLTSSQFKPNRVEKKLKNYNKSNKVSISSLNTRASEFSKTERKLRNKIMACTNTDLYNKNAVKTENFSSKEDDLSFANNTDLPPWFSSNIKKINKNILYKPHIPKS